MKPSKSNKNSQDFLPHYLQDGSKMANQKATIIKKRFLVFNDNGQSKSLAILRIWNPTANSDVFYKLHSDGDKLGFQVKSWKGRVRKNNYVDVTIAANMKSADAGDKQQTAAQDDLPTLSLTQLCQTKFRLEMTECSTKWRPGNAHRTEQNLVVKIELHCITRQILMQIQSETSLNMDNVSDSWDHIERLIFKYLEAPTLAPGGDSGGKPLLSDYSGALPSCNDQSTASDKQLATSSNSPVKPPMEQSSQECSPSSDSTTTENDSLDMEPEQEVVDVSPMKSESPTKSKPLEKSLDKPTNISSALVVLLMLIMDMVADVFSSVALFSKQLLSKVALRFGSKQVLAKSSTQKVMGQSGAGE